MASSADMVPRRRRKLIRSIHNNGESNSNSDTASKLFMSMVTDHVLWEILVRLPHAKHVIRCSLVSKRWQSLVRHAQFTPEFSRQNLGRIEDNNFDLFFGMGGNAPVCRKSALYRLYREKKSETYRFYPKLVSKQWPDIKLRSSSLDLMVFKNKGMNEIHVCNPLTRQWLKIDGPNPSLRTWCYTGIAADVQNFGQYKVVVLEDRWDEHPFVFDYKLDIHVFCSRTGSWTHSKFTLPNISEDYEIRNAISSQGVVYFPFTDRDGVIGVLVCSVLESSRFRYVERPVEGFDLRGRLSCTRVFFGVVSGRLRVSQLLKRENVFSLKIWELREDDDYSWVLVHDASLVSGNEDNTRLFVVAFHPYNGDVVFVLRDCKYICRYHNIRGGDEYEIVGRLPICDFLPLRVKNSDFSSCMKTFTIVHTLWPTPLSHITRPQ